MLHFSKMGFPTEWDPSSCTHATMWFLVPKLVGRGRYNTILSLPNVGKNGISIVSYIATNVSNHEAKKTTSQSHARMGDRTSTYQYSKWESRFCLGLDAAKNTHRIKKSFK